MSQDGRSQQRTRRGQRLASALRDNLKKRKEQARGRGGAAAEPPPEAPPRSPGEAKEPQGDEPSAPRLPPQHVPT